MLEAKAKVELAEDVIRGNEVDEEEDMVVSGLANLLVNEAIVLNLLLFAYSILAFTSKERKIVLREI